MDNDTRIRVTAYDVRESVSHTALPLGCALVSLRSLVGNNCNVGAEGGRLRVALRSLTGTTVGFVSMSGYRLERDDHRGGSSESTPCRQPQIRGPVSFLFHLQFDLIIELNATLLIVVFACDCCRL